MRARVYADHDHERRCAKVSMYKWRRPSAGVCASIQCLLWCVPCELRLDRIHVRRRGSKVSA